MGRSTRDQAAYRDDPDAVSLRTTPDDFNYDDAPLISDDAPPAYGDAGPETPITSDLPGIGHIPPPSRRMDHNTDVTLSKGVPKVIETQELMDPQYDNDPKYLEQGIRSFALIPPNPLIYIMGTHQETYKEEGKKKQRTVTDFRIVLNMQKYIRAFDEDFSGWSVDTVENGDKTHRGSFRKSRAPGAKQDIEVGAPKPTLTEWCHRYCASPAKLKM
jgi:hypothetical protein